MEWDVIGFLGKGRSESKGVKWNGRDRKEGVGDDRRIQRGLW